jgi:NAD(P)H dehydrogenase (quinone)
MFIVTGAAGQLGRKIVTHLLTQVPAHEIGVSVRDPRRVADLAALGVRVRQGDYADPDSLRSAWEGATRLVLISSNAAATGGNPLQQHSTAIAVACDLRVKRVFYTSHMASAATSLFPPCRDHAATEAMLAASGLAWTALRHGFYASSGLMMNARGLKAGMLAAPLDGKVAWTTHDDLAAADAGFLAGVETIDGPTPPLTGSLALDLADIAHLAEDITGKPVGRKVVSDDEAVEATRKAGVPEGSVAVMLGYYRAVRAGEFAATDPLLARLLGRAPMTMRQFMIDNLGEGQAG